MTDPRLRYDPRTQFDTDRKDHDMITNALVEGRDLRKTYQLGKRAAVPALRGVDISIAEGEMVAIMGPSGSGKSTLMHILGLLHAPETDGGPRPELWFEGRDMTRLGESERTRIRAKRMGFVFQSFNLVPTLTAQENVMLACDYAGVKGTKAQAAAEHVLRLVGLGDRGDHRPAELSGGEQQRIATARALVNQPSLILADEPTGNLDSVRAREVLDLMRWFNREHGQTLLLVTHDPEVGEACDRVVHMRDGLVADHGLVPAAMPVTVPQTAIPTAA
ncbi:MAG: ABC transporter ATP-binding protein [Candidatus Limnocylindrales bacterium]